MLRVVKRIILWLVLIVAMLYLLNYSSLPLGDEWTQVAVIARNEQFDYVGWEINALAVKTAQTLYGLQPFMDETTRSAYVRSYMDDLGYVQRIEAQIAAIYADPTVSDPAAASADLRAQRDTHRADLRDRQALAEAILEGQVAAVLVDQGFGLGGSSCRRSRCTSPKCRICWSSPRAIKFASTSRSISTRCRSMKWRPSKTRSISSWASRR